MQIQAKDLKRFCDKLTDVVTGKEIKKYKEYKSQVRVWQDGPGLMSCLHCPGYFTVLLI